jgi:hypothetical protein
MAFAILLGMSDSGKVQCCKCEYVFRPRSRFREIGCLIMLLVLMGGLIGLMIFSIIR